MYYSNLRAEMARKRMKYIDLGVILGLSRQSVSLKLMGKSHFSLKQAFIVAKYMESTIEYLFYEIGVRAPDVVGGDKDDSGDSDD